MKGETAEFLANVEEWKRHLFDHVPFRRDCRTCCLETMGMASPRRRSNNGFLAFQNGVMAAPVVEELLGAPDEPYDREEDMTFKAGAFRAGAD